MDSESSERAAPNLWSSPGAMPPAPPGVATRANMITTPKGLCDFTFHLLAPNPGRAYRVRAHNTVSIIAQYCCVAVFPCWTVHQVGFQGDLQEFIEFLRTDERLYVDTPEALMKAVALIMKKMGLRSPAGVYRMRVTTGMTTICSVGRSHLARC